MLTDAEVPRSQLCSALDLTPYRTTANKLKKSSGLPL